MALSATAELTIAGIPASGDWGGGTLSVPLVSISDFRGGWVPTRAAKVGNDDAVDPSVNLTYYPLVSAAGLKGGFAKDFDPQAARYYLPSPDGTGDTLGEGATAWTLCEQASILPGAGVQTQNGAYSLSDFTVYGGSLYAIDVKYKRVLRENSGTWQVYSGNAWRSAVTAGAGTVGTITSVANNGGLFRCTSTAHGLVNGDKVVVSGSSLSALNGAWTVTRIDDNTFDLQASTYGAGSIGTVTWVCDAAQLTKTPTEITVKVNANNSVLLVGQGASGDSSVVRTSSNGTTWSNWTVGGVAVNGQHFAQVDDRIWYSTGAQLCEGVPASKSPLQPYIGDVNNPILGVAQGDKFLLATKADGAYRVWRDSAAHQRQLVSSVGGDTDNGRFIQEYSGSLWFSLNGMLYEYDGTTVLRHPIYVIDGNATQPFYGGMVIAGWAAGRILFLLYKVTTATATVSYNYYLLAYDGAAGGFHNLYYYTSTTDEAPDTGAVALCASKVYYSIGNDASNQSRTGYLRTDASGTVPQGDSTNPWTKNVALAFGRWDGGNPNVDKWLWKLAVALEDNSSGNNKGKVKAYYKKKWGDAWTVIAESAAGTSDYVELTIPAETGLQAGIVCKTCYFKVELTNVDTSPTSAWYVKSVHVVGWRRYTPAYACSFNVNLDMVDNVEGIAEFNSKAVLAALKAGIAQSAPVTLTTPDGSSYLGQLEPLDSGDIMQSADEDGKPQQRIFRVSFLQGA